MKFFSYVYTVLCRNLFNKFLKNKHQKSFCEKTNIYKNCTKAILKKKKDHCKRIVKN